MFSIIQAIRQPAVFSRRAVQRAKWQIASGLCCSNECAGELRVVKTPRKRDGLVDDRGKRCFAVRLWLISVGSEVQFDLP
jgi:hypothetical protein